VIDSYEYIRNIGRYLPSKTPQAALKAAQDGFLPVEAFEYAAVSVKSLYMEPFDFAELERIVNRGNNDLETNLLLMQVFRKILLDPDPEKALFGAEGINTIEGRYAERIEKLRKDASETGSPDSLIECAGLYRELALLSGERIIRNFYLKEAFSLLREAGRSGPLGRNDGVLMVRILLDLGIWDQSKRILAQLIEEGGGEDAELVFLCAESDFRRGDHAGAARWISRLEGKLGLLDVEELSRFRFWKGV
jgi:hypothetical protein